MMNTRELNWQWRIEFFIDNATDLDENDSTHYGEYSDNFGKSFDENLPPDLQKEYFGDDESNIQDL